MYPNTAIGPIIVPAGLTAGAGTAWAAGWWLVALVLSLVAVFTLLGAGAAVCRVLPALAWPRQLSPHRGAHRQPVARYHKPRHVPRRALLRR